MNTMKAVRIHAYGGPEVLKYEEAPRPRVQPDRSHAGQDRPACGIVSGGDLSKQE